MPERRRARILHVSGDFPDNYEPRKTNVIRSLCNLVSKRFDQRVVSLNRVRPDLSSITRVVTHVGRNVAVDLEPESDEVISVRYHAPGRGILHRAVLESLADSIADQISDLPRPDLLVGHKLTIEGLVVARLSARWGVPYALSVQGNTDTRILAARPDLASSFRRIWHEAAVAFPFTPWAHRAVARRLGIRRDPTVELPCPTDLDTILAPAVSGSSEIASVFHLRNLALKNLPRLARAADVARTCVPTLRVRVVGGGEGPILQRAETLAARHASILLEGPLPNAAIPERMNRAAGFAMPSLRESFGLVFIEALMAGCPILYPAGRAVDGWFEGLPFAIRVDARNVNSIAEGLIQLVRDEARLKEALARWQNEPGVERFRRPAIARAYGDALAAAAGGRSSV